MSATSLGPASRPLYSSASPTPYTHAPSPGPRQETYDSSAPSYASRPQGQAQQHYESRTPDGRGRLSEEGVRYGTPGVMVNDEYQAADHWVSGQHHGGGGTPYVRFAPWLLLRAQVDARKCSRNRVRTATRSMTLSGPTKTCTPLRIPPSSSTLTIRPDTKVDLAPHRPKRSL